MKTLPRHAARRRVAKPLDGNTLIGDLLDKNPGSFFVLAKHLGLLTLTCPGSRYESLISLARRNGVRSAQLVKDLNRFLAPRPARHPTVRPTARRV